MWFYDPFNGDLRHNGVLVGSGYSGAYPQGFNNPAMQKVHSVGPIPQGQFTFGKAYTHIRLGIITIPILPKRGTNMYGRDDFFMHGPDLLFLLHSSEGCMVFTETVRVHVNESSDKDLTVLAASGSAIQRMASSLAGLFNSFKTPVSQEHFHK